MKMLQMFVAGLLGFLSLVGAALADGPDLTSLTSAVTFTTVIAAVLGIFASMVGFRLAWKGGEKVLAALRKL